MEGISFMVTVTFDTDAAQGLFEMVQANTLLPKPKPVILVVGNKEFVIVPLPEINVQAPLPMPGKLAAIIAVGLVIHNV